MLWVHEALCVFEHVAALKWVCITTPNARALWIVSFRFQLPNAYVCLRFFIYKRPKMKLGSCYWARRIQFSGPTLIMRLSSLNIKLERLCCSLSSASRILYLRFYVVHVTPSAHEHAMSLPSYEPYYVRKWYCGIRRNLKARIDYEMREVFYLFRNRSLLLKKYYDQRQSFWRAMFRWMLWKSARKHDQKSQHVVTIRHIMHVT